MSTRRISTEHRRLRSLPEWLSSKTLTPQVVGAGQIIGCAIWDDDGIEMIIQSIAGTMATCALPDGSIRVEHLYSGRAIGRKRAKTHDRS